MMEIPAGMQEQFLTAKALIEDNDNIKIYTHTDCDGICSGAILSIILDRLGKDYDIEFVNLDEIEDLDLDYELTIFSDLGSGQGVDKNAKDNQKILILDHHPPLRDINYKDDKPYFYLEINPLFYGIDGSYYVCGGGLCYFLAKTFGFKDLSWIGVLAGIGDMQNTKTGHFEGLNTIIQQDAIDEGLLEVTENDLNIYGRSTRPLYVALSYFSDVKLTITNNQQEAKAILEELGIDEKHDRKTLSELTEEDKDEIKKFLGKMISKKVPPKYLKHVPKLIIGDSYTFLMEEEGSFLRDGSEFSTAMNACGRNDEEEIGVDILKGDRLVALDNLEEVSKNHKYNLATSISKVADKYHSEIIELDNFQYFDCEDINQDIATNIIGTITGMVLGYCNWKKPIIGFSKSKNGQVKVSLRCSKLLSYDGIHFGNIIREISNEVGGTGGGHAVACGAYIPTDKKSEFIDKFNKELEGKIAK